GPAARRPGRSVGHSTLLFGMKLLDRYVFWSFVRNYLISFMVLVGMYVVLDMVLNFHDLVDVKGQVAANQDAGVFDTVYRIADYYFFRCFLIFVYLSGIIPVVAAAFTLMRLSRFNELTAVLAAGVPMLRIAMPVIIGGVIANALLIADQELVIPRIIPKLQRDPDELSSDAKSFPINALQDANGAIWRATKYTPQTGATPPTMEVVDIIERREEPRTETLPDGTRRTRVLYFPAAHTSADRAVWNPADQSWTLTNGVRNEMPGNGAPAVTPDGRAPVLPRDRYASNVTPEEIALYRSADYVELLGTAKIEELLNRPGSYGQMHLLRVKHSRFMQPIINVILLLLAIPCVLTREPGKLKAAATKCLVLTGLGMGAVFVSHQLATKPMLDMRPDLWTAFAAWLPILLFGPLAMFLLGRVKT
ncbi:MAG TPA: LptF/LptG family permease, partial [Humisphaera sp.]